MKIKKRPFLLIELFVGLILLGILLTLFGSLPFKYAKKELFALQELQIERLKDVAYCNFISTPHTYSSDTKTTLVGPYVLHGLDEKEEIFLSVEYHFKKLKNPKEKKDEETTLLQAKVYYKKFTPSTYSVII